MQAGELGLGVVTPPPTLQRTVALQKEGLAS